VVVSLFVEYEKAGAVCDCVILETAPELAAVTHAYWLPAFMMLLQTSTNIEMLAVAAAACSDAWWFHRLLPPSPKRHSSSRRSHHWLKVLQPYHTSCPDKLGCSPQILQTNICPAVAGSTACGSAPTITPVQSKWQFAAGGPMG
jgi:hypothetical protein